MASGKKTENASIEPLRPGLYDGAAFGQPASYDGAHGFNGARDASNEFPDRKPHPEL